MLDCSSRFAALLRLRVRLSSGCGGKRAGDDNRSCDGPANGPAPFACRLAWRRCLISPFSRATLSIRDGAGATLQVAALVALLPALLAGVQSGGLVGVGIGHIVVVLLVTMPVYLVVTYRVTGAGVGVALRALSRPGLAAVAACGGCSVGD
jgi:hypothetical protein